MYFSVVLGADVQQPIENKPSMISRFARRFIYPFIAWIARFRRKRLVVALLALFGLIGVLYGYAENAYKIFTPVYKYVYGDPEAEEAKRKHLANAFIIGGNLGEYTFLQDHFKKGPPASPKLDTLKGRSASCAEAINSTAADEGIKIDVNKLEVNPLLPGQWDTSHGYRILREAVRGKGGNDAAAIFEAAFHAEVAQKLIAVGEVNLTGNFPFQEQIRSRLNSVTYLGMPEYKIPSFFGDDTTKKSTLSVSLFNWQHDVKGKLKI